MKKKKLIVIVLVAIGLVAGYNMYISPKKVKLSDLVLANVEALANIEGDGSCPNPYDVYNHQLSFTQRTGRFTLDANCEASIAGKKIKILGVSANATVTITYELGNCNQQSPGNCCPNSRNGEINIISSR